MSKETIVGLCIKAGYSVEPWNDAYGDHFQVLKDGYRVTSEAFSHQKNAWLHAASWVIDEQHEGEHWELSDD